MRRCKFRFVDSLECPLEALPGEDYCYWHKEEDGKSPDDEKLEELKKYKILGVYLRKTRLRWRDLREAFLAYANLQEAELWGTNLQKAFLVYANLQGSDLHQANLQEADLCGANLQEARLCKANLQGSDLVGAELKRSDLREANIQGANLRVAKLQEADLWGAELQRANLSYVIVDSKTRLDRANLTYTNLYNSYIDETKSLRLAILGEREINEFVADAVGEGIELLDLEKIREKRKEKASELIEKGAVVHVSDKYRVILFDRDRGIAMFKEEGIEFEYLDDVDEFHLDVDRQELRTELYKASYEVYNKLYNFYIQNGMIDEALKYHYRRCEVRRKLLRTMGGFVNKLRSFFFDFLILKLLTGYGVKVGRPLIISAIIILFFAILYWATKGIVKIVNGRVVEPSLLDYLYHSIITFTSLGYANIQPNVSNPISQILVSAESILGALMISLLIFTVTYRISR
ncbi:MAG: hypothetical protein DRP01_09305 [Archaeoglobales archaeon]|nr:MAG: hypothetical protein DRP01_09305 [Archaeoglobales archaeon]